MASTRDVPSTVARSTRATGEVVVAADGRYLDADPAALDILGVTLDVLREKRIGDFSPPQYADEVRALWAEWITSGARDAGGEATGRRPDGQLFRTRQILRRESDGTTRIRVTSVDEAPQQPPAVRIQTLLGHWRALERRLAQTPGDGPDAAALQRRIDAAREEYQRRTEPRSAV